MKQTYNATLVKALAKKYKISPRYVRYCLKGERSPSFADKIKKDYKRFINKIENVIERECKSK
jgi:hypothetical protein